MIACGTLCVALGVIGIFLPIMPTTVFLLLAAACYARSSEQFYHRLLNHRYLGSYIRNHREGRGMKRRDKIVTLVMLTVTNLRGWGTAPRAATSGVRTSERVLVRPSS